MNPMPFRRATALCALLASTALATCGLTAAPAAAQALGDTERQAPDENGVDVISGKLSVPVQSIAAGRAESGLVYANGWSGGQYFDTFKVEIALAASTTVTVFGSAKRFTDNGDGSFSPVDADGSTLVFDSTINGYVLTTRDGTVLKFLKSLGDTGTGAVVVARIATIARPDGETITYHHRLEPGQGCTGFPCTPLLAAGRVQSVTSNLGHQLKATYASDSYTTGTQADFKRLTKVTAINNAVDVCDPDADSCAGLTLAWPELVLGQSGTTRTFTDNLAQTTSVATAAGGPTSVTSPAGGGTDLSVTYDAGGRVATLATGGGSWGYSYADSGSQRTTIVTQPLGGSKTYVSDLAIKRVLGVTDELGRTTSFQYDASGRLTRTTLPEGNYAQITYDSRGNVTNRTQAAKAGSGLASIVASAAFPAACPNPKTCNQPISTTDERGFVTDYTYDSSHGGLLTATLPAPTTGAVRPQMRLTYSSVSAYYKNSAGTIVAAPSPVYRLTAVSACRTLASCAGGADEVKATLAYGSPGTANNLFVSSVSRGAGDNSLTAVSAFAYDAFGNLVTVDGPLSGPADTAGFRYDALRRLTMTVSPDPDGAGALKHRAARMSYDSDGNLIRVESGTTTSLGGAFALMVNVARAELGYDALGRRISEALQIGPLPGGPGTPLTQALTGYSYDIKGRLDCTALRMNGSTFGSPPASACTAATAGSFGPDRIAKNLYDNADQLVQVRTAVGVAGEEAAEASASYTANGLVLTLTDAESNRTTFDYDGHDRVAKARSPLPTKGANASSTTDYEQPIYESLAGGTRTSHLVASFRNRAGETIAYGYDALGRLTSKNRPGTEPDVGFAYDNLGRLTASTQTGEDMSFGYDALGRMQSQTNPAGTMRASWDLAGRRAQLKWPDNSFVDYDFLVTGEMAKIRNNGATSGADVLVAYGYDDLGRRTSLTRGNGTATTYGYDVSSRLTQMTHDLGGGSTTQDLTLGLGYNPAGQIVSVSRSNDAYAWTKAANGTTATAADGLNRIASWSAPLTYDAKGNVTSDGTNGFGFSSENLLTSLTVPPWPAGTLSYDPLMRFAETQGSRFVRFEDEMVAEYYNGAMIARFVPGASLDETPARINGATRQWYYPDERGSTIAVAGDSGTATSILAYDEYGGPGVTGLPRIGFTGQVMLSFSQLYDSRNRNYHAGIGRFLQTDPIGYQGGMNLYAYVKGDPVNRSDPAGLECDCGGPIVITGHRRKSDSTGSDEGSSACGMLKPQAGFQRSACVMLLGYSRPGANWRTLTEREIRFYQCLGIDAAHLERIQLQNGIGFPESLVGMGAVTYSSSRIAYRNEFPAPDAIFSNDYALFVLSEEVGHTVQYAQGMTWSQYLSELKSTGYDNNRFEDIAKKWARSAVDANQSGRCEGWGAY